MTFSYNADLSLDRDRMRFYIGDTVSDAGVRPDGSNFSDEELDGLISAEGSWQAAIAAAAEILAMLYAPEVDIAIGPRKESLSQAAVRYETAWRRQAGRSSLTQVAPTRVDGFSQDVDAEDV